MHGFKVIVPGFFEKPKKDRIGCEEIANLAKHMFKLPKQKLFDYLIKIRKNKKKDFSFLFGSFVIPAIYTTNTSASDLDLLVVSKGEHKNKSVKKYGFLSVKEISKSLFDKQNRDLKRWKFYIFAYPHILIKESDFYHKLYEEAAEYFYNDENEMDVVLHLPLYVIRKNIYIKEDKKHVKKFKKELEGLVIKAGNLNWKELTRIEELEVILFSDEKGNREMMRYIVMKKVCKNDLINWVERIMLEKGFKKSYIKKAKSYLRDIYPSIY